MRRARILLGTSPATQLAKNACFVEVLAQLECMQDRFAHRLSVRKLHAAAVRHNAATSPIVSSNAAPSSSAARASKSHGFAGQNMISYINGLLLRYEDFVGLRELREAQQQVRQAEKKFSEAQSSRREYQTKLRQIQHSLKAVHSELDKTSRGEDRYLTLLTQEHEKIKEEKALLTVLDEVEGAERYHFSLLSNAVRDSHERERARAEKTKYWSIIGSVAGAIIGIVGTSLNNWLKMRELRGLILTTSANSALVIGDEHSATGGKAAPGTVASVHRLLTELVARTQRQQTQMEQLLANERGQIISSSAESISREHAEVVREEVAEALRNAQQNLEWRLKVNSIVSAAFLYTAVVLTLPVVLYFFGGAAGGAAAAGAAKSLE